MPDRQMDYIPLVWLGHVICESLVYLLSWRTNGCESCMSKPWFPGDLPISEQ